MWDHAKCGRNGDDNGSENTGFECGIMLIVERMTMTMVLSPQGFRRNVSENVILHDTENRTQVNSQTRVSSSSFHVSREDNQRDRERARKMDSRTNVTVILVANITNSIPTFKMNPKIVFLQNLPSLVTAGFTGFLSLISFVMMVIIYFKIFRRKKKTEEKREEERKKREEEEEEKRKKREEERKRKREIEDGQRRRMKEEDDRLKKMEEGGGGGGGSGTSATRGGIGGGFLGLFGYELVSKKKKKQMMEEEEEAMKKMKRELEEEMKRKQKEHEEMMMIKKKRDDAEEERRWKEAEKLEEEMRKKKEEDEDLGYSFVETLFSGSSWKQTAFAIEYIAKNKGKQSGEMMMKKNRNEEDERMKKKEDDAENKHPDEANSVMSLKKHNSKLVKSLKHLSTMVKREKKTHELFEVKYILKSLFKGTNRKIIEIEYARGGVYVLFYDPILGLCKWSMDLTSFSDDDGTASVPGTSQMQTAKVPKIHISMLVEKKTDTHTVQQYMFETLFGPKCRRSLWTLKQDKEGFYILFCDHVLGFCTWTTGFTSADSEIASVDGSSSPSSADYADAVSDDGYAYAAVESTPPSSPTADFARGVEDVRRRLEAEWVVLDELQMDAPEPVKRSLMAARGAVYDAEIAALGAGAEPLSRRRLVEARRAAYDAEMAAVKAAGSADCPQ